MGRIAGLCLAMALASACGDSRTGTRRVNPTYVEVAPQEFLGDLECTSTGGGPRWYVATLIDVTGGANFRLPSSPPTSCRNSVFFSGVVPEGRALGEVHQAHEYVADIEMYDAASLRPKHEGSSVMLVSGQTVAPGWVGSCGSDRSTLAPLLGLDAGTETETDESTLFEGPLTPSYGRTVTFRDCSLVALSDAGTEARVSVALDSALSGLECGTEPGQVDRFEVTLNDEVKSAACGSEVVFSDLEAGSFVEFSVEAFERTQSDAGAPSWTTTCYQEPAPGRQLAARCDPLVGME